MTETKINRMIAGVIYRAVKGPYDEDYPEYDCFCPCEYVTPNCVIGDCWVCDKNGNVHPGYSNCGVPVCRENLGETVGKMPTQE